VRERDDDLLLAAAGLEERAVVVERVLAERDAQLRDRDRDDGDAGHRLGGLRVRAQVDRAVEAERLAARGDRRVVVLAGQTVGHGRQA
jgi:hypothetical protein